VDLANTFTNDGDILHLSKTQKIMKIVHLTNTCKQMNALPTTNDISCLQMPLIKALFCEILGSHIPTRKSKYITEANYRGSLQEPQCNAVCHTDCPMLRDGERSSCSALAVYCANMPCHNFSVTVAIPDGPSPLFRCKLSGIIVAGCAVENGTNLLVQLDGTSIVKS
jgi:hypothetical protein